MTNCNLCKKKIPFLMNDIYSCRCDNNYCRLHIHDHNCTFNYYELWKKQTDKSLPKVVKQKVEKL